ncbi:MAG TPA: hypothetical protein VJ739_04570 [Gemmataceae bacterium]|nr:hypothetical protein [Gemmataceae bacterium]
MKYFKPELLRRCRSLDDDAADVAAAEWEQAIAAYRARLRAIRSRLPSGADRLLARFTLHDAQLLTIADDTKRPRLTLLVRLEGTRDQPGPVLELSYLLVAGPHGGVVFRKHAGLGHKALGPRGVLYDELNLDEERAFFTHSLLLTDGFEIEIRFHDLRVRARARGQALFPSPELPEGERTWPLIEV